MCQLNVYMIDKFVSGVDVKEIFNKHHHHNFENINEEVVIKNYDDDFNYYEASNNRCDCGSVLGKLNNYIGKFNTYCEYLESNKKDKVLKLYKIKELLLSRDYNQQLEKLLTTKNELFTKLNDYNHKIKDLEIELADLQITDKPNLQDQIKIKQLSSKLREAKNNLDNNNHYKLAREVYEDYIAKNELLISSQNYTLEYKKDWWQENIDLAINKAEHEYHDHTNAEFNHLKFILNDILKLTDEVKLFSFWQGDAERENDYFNSLTEVKTTTLDELKLEDLIFLNYKDVVTIKRPKTA